MSAKYLLYFTATDHYVYRLSRRALALEAEFTADDAGALEFREYLRGKKRALFYLVADLAGEDFHEDQIPYLRGGDRQAVIERRLAQRYRDTRLAAALSLGYVTGERRNERLLLASFTNTQQFTPWLDALTESGTKLAGVFSVPLAAPALAARLGARGGRCFVITTDRAGLRQCFIEDGKLRFARLERIADMAPEDLAAFVRSETIRLGQYLTTLRALPREGPPVQVMVVAPAGHKATFERVLASDARFVFHIFDLDEAARAAKTSPTPAEALAERLFLHLTVKQTPKEQFARREDRRGYVLWQLQRGIVLAGAAGLAACALYAGAQWVDVISTRGQAASEQREANFAAERYRRITATFPVTQTTTDNLKATVVEFRKIADATAWPEPAFVHLSKALDEFPQIELESLIWRVGPPGGSNSGASRSGAAASAGLLADKESEELEIGGRVATTRGSDYRAITAEVQRFAQALSSGSPYQVANMQLPFDITSQGTLTGDIGSTARSEAPRFTIVLSRALK
ncbi:MAG: hypothetical protein WCA17_12360 [Burkholderiales bacterium]